MTVWHTVYWRIIFLPINNWSHSSIYNPIIIINVFANYWRVNGCSGSPTCTWFRSGLGFGRLHEPPDVWVVSSCFNVEDWTCWIIISFEFPPQIHKFVWDQDIWKLSFLPLAIIIFTVITFWNDVRKLHISPAVLKSAKTRFYKQKSYTNTLKPI